MLLYDGLQQQMFGVSAARIDNCFEGESREEDTERKKNYEGSLENGEITQFYFKKLVELELAVSLVVAINLYLIVVATSQSFPAITEETRPTLNICLYFAMICTVVAAALLGMRSLTVLKLQKEQKGVYEKATLFSSKKVLYLGLQWIILLLQPYPFLTGISLASRNDYDDYPIEYPLNDLMAILSLGRIYVLLRTALVLTPYMNNRSNRLCKMYGCRADFSYSLKCMFKDHPLKLICLLYSLIAVILAYAVYLAERQLAVQTGGLKLEGASTSYLNSLWLILITTTTVGYGDYSPNTPLGRIIILFVAIWGTLIVSIMVVVVSNTLSMEKTEVRTAKILNKLQLREQLEKQAVKVVGYFMLTALRTTRNTPRRRQLARLMRRAQGQFAQIRKAIKQIAEFDDLQDEIATHFLKLNSDIDTLNSNQDAIIQYIHTHFNARPAPLPARTPPPEQQYEYLDPQEVEQQDESAQFMATFRSKLKQKRQ